uniref:Uncharacterized protein MANES_17G039100 n=1 Tax=Rhizophora mucronata TaxID=61149 RepID=A0A2P2PLJ7_RHIMU
MKSMTISSYNPLFSCIITLSALILLYFPCALKFSASIVFTPTLLFLLFLLRLGAGQRVPHQNPAPKDDAGSEEKNGDAQLVQGGDSEFFTPLDACRSETVLDRSPNPDFEESFVEWDVRAPLEVIYEAYEGEEDEEDSDPTRFMDLETYPSLSTYYPETDSDSLSEGEFPITRYWGSPENDCFEWEEEVREGLGIEIALDANCKKHPDPGFHVEEDNLIEIDIYPDSGQA